MTNEERDKDMDWIFKCVYGERGSYTLYSETTSALAVKECDRKARAWDALEKWIHSFHIRSIDGEGCLDIVRAKIKEILAPPKPKSKLEQARVELRYKAYDEHAIDSYGNIVSRSKVVKVEDALEILRRLEAEDE